MERIKWKDVCYMQLSVLVLSFSNVFSKMAALEDGITKRFLLFYGISMLIMVLYAVFWQQILKRVSMTVAYSSRLVTMIWGVIWGCLFFHETVTVFNLLGTVIIFLGLYRLVGTEYEN